jgi:DNA replication protein DnaC
MKKTCDKHGEYQVEYWTVGDHKIELACPVCREEQERKEDEEMRRIELNKQKEQFERFMTSANIPKRYWHKELADFITEDTHMMKAITGYIDNQEQVSRLGRSIIMIGKPGTGKTHIACCILKNWYGRKYYVNARAYTREIKDTFNSSESEKKVIDRYTGYDLLVIDEIGKQMNTDHERYAMFDLINERYNQNKPTIIASNLNIADLTEFLGSEVIDRFNENGGMRIFFKGESKRR